MISYTKETVKIQIVKFPKTPHSDVLHISKVQKSSVLFIKYLSYLGHVIVNHNLYSVSFMDVWV